MAVIATIEHLDIASVRHKPVGKHHDLLGGRTTGQRMTGDCAESYVAKVGSTAVHRSSPAGGNPRCKSASLGEEFGPNAPFVVSPDVEDSY
jgi:hypothetical protein